MNTYCIIYRQKYSNLDKYTTKLRGMHLCKIPYGARFSRHTIFAITLLKHFTAKFFTDQEIRLAIPIFGKKMQATVYFHDGGHPNHDS